MAFELKPIVDSFALVAVSEMGDKTQFLAFSLASRYRRPGVIMAGILLATLVNHALAASAGSYLAALAPPRILSWVLCVAFVAFGIWALIPDKEEETREMSGWGAFTATVVLFFLAEMGDKTQLATLALGAKYSSVLSVTTGTTLGMMLADGVAVFFGDRLGARLTATHQRWIRWASAALFFLFAIGAALSAPTLHQ